MKANLSVPNIKRQLDSKAKEFDVLKEIFRGM